jgi:hypothetical protein
MARPRRRLAYLTAASIALWLARHELASAATNIRGRLDRLWARKRGLPEPSNPSDAVTVTELIATSVQQGFTEEFVLTPDGIRCRGCGELSPPNDYGFESLRRLEGASDPDDSQAVLAVHCPVCDAAGSLVVNYGPAASAEEADALAAMQDRRDASNVPTGAAPGENDSR